MADKTSLLLEAERRGLLPYEKQQLLNEARSRGLIGPPLNSDTIPSGLDRNAKPAEVEKNKFVEAISGGKSGTWEQFLYNNEIPDETKLGRISQLLDASGMTGLMGIGPIAETPAIIPAVGRYIPNISPKVVEYAKMPFKAAGNAAGNLAAHLVGQFGTGTGRESIKVPFKVGMSGVPEDISILKQGMRSKGKIDPKVQLAEDLASGDKWSRKVVGDMGPGGEGVTEAARNYQLQKGLTPAEAASFKASRSGIIVPNKFEKTVSDASEAIPSRSKEELYQAGQDLSSWAPKSRWGKELGGLDILAMLSHTIDPLSGGAFLALESPRLVGESVLKIGQGVGKAGRASKAAADLTAPYLKSVPGALSNSQILGAIGALNADDTPDKNYKKGGLGLSLAVPVAQYAYDRYNAPAEPTAKQAAEQKPGFSIGGSVAAILAKKAAEAAAKKTAESAAKKSATVMRPKRVAYPGIYSDPKQLVAEATSRVEEESPLLKRLFGVTRDDLFNIAEQGTRKGNITERPFKAAPNATGAGHAQEVMNPRNVQRIQDIIGESKNSPELYKGMASWYTMDPLFNRYVELYGLENAIKEYNRFNTFTGMASPGSEVLVELNRGSAANWLDSENRFSDFIKYGRKAGTGPEDMQNVLGHKYHITSHGLPMSKYIESGIVDMGSAKVPSYIAASGVPETGFQTSWPVGDAHWSRLVGLPDVRGPRTLKGVEVLPNASASVPEMVSLGPWWEEKIAKPMELESVPAQAVVWGSGSGATGVTSPIGAPKLELISKLIGDTANRLGVSPETARDLVILRKTHLAKGGLVQGYDDGGKVDLANSSKYIDGSSRENNPYGYVLDDSNSRMDVSPRASLDRANISDRGNLVHNMVSERDRLTDKYLGSTGRLASKGLEYLRTALDKAPSFTGKTLSSMGIDPNYVPIVGPMVAASRPTRQSDVVNGELKIGTDLLLGQLPETLYDYTTSGQPGFVRGNEWVPNTAAGGMMHTDPYGDINAFDLFNLLGIETPIAAGAKAAYEVARPLARSAAEHTVSGINYANRALRTPDPLLMNVETSTANRSDDAAETLRRFKEAAGSSKDYPVGQGVWTGEEGAAQFHPNVMANIEDFSPEQVDHMRRMLDQYGIGAGRFRSDLISQPSRANAIQVLDADPEWIKNIGQHYAQSDLPAVVFAQPNNRAMVFNMNSDMPKDLSVLLDAPQLKGKKVRYGKATIPTDRNYIDSVESARVTGTKKPPKKKAK